jgi:ribosomal protein S4
MIVIQKKHKLTRKYLCNLWGKHNASVLKRNTIPGQHPNVPVNLSGYSLRLKAKQKIKFYYGAIRESKMTQIYKKVMGHSENKGLAVFQFLERALSTVVYRSGWAPSVFGARQLVSHTHIKVNGKVVKSPLFQVKDGDLVTLDEALHGNEHVLRGLEIKKQQHTLSHLNCQDKFKTIFERDVILSDLEEMHHFDVQKEMGFMVEWYAGRC